MDKKIFIIHGWGGFPEEGWFPWLARYIESLPKGLKISGAVFVAGFFKKLDGANENPELETIASHWLNAPLNFEKVKSHIPKSIATFSDNDPHVPLENQDEFKNHLG